MNSSRNFTSKQQRKIQIKELHSLLLESDEPFSYDNMMLIINIISNDIQFFWSFIFNGKYKNKHRNLKTMLLAVVSGSGYFYNWLLVHLPPPQLLEFLSLNIESKVFNNSIIETFHQYSSVLSAENVRALLNCILIHPKTHGDEFYFIRKVLQKRTPHNTMILIEFNKLRESDVLYWPRNKYWYWHENDWKTKSNKSLYWYLEYIDLFCKFAFQVESNNNNLDFVEEINGLLNDLKIKKHHLENGVKGEKHKKEYECFFLSNVCYGMSFDDFIKTIENKLSKIKTQNIKNLLRLIVYNRNGDERIVNKIMDFSV